MNCVDYCEWKQGGIQTNGIGVFCLCSCIRPEDQLITAKIYSCIHFSPFSNEMFTLQTTIWRNCCLLLLYCRQFIHDPKNNMKGNDLIAGDSWLIKFEPCSLMILELNTVLQRCEAYILLRVNTSVGSKRKFNCWGLWSVLVALWRTFLFMLNEVQSPID